MTSGRRPRRSNRLRAPRDHRLVAILLIVGAVRIFGLVRIVHCEEPLDKLVQKADTASGAARIEVLLQIAGLHKNSNPDESLRYGNLAAEESRRIGYRKGEGRGEYYVGTALYNLAKYAEAVAHTQNALKILETISDAEGCCMALLALGIVEEQLGHRAEALQHYEKSLDLAIRIDSPRHMGNSLHNAAGVYMDQGDLSKARVYLERAVAAYQSGALPESTAHPLMSLGVLALRQGDRQQAISRFEEAARIFRQANQKVYLSLALGNVACMHLEDRDFERAFPLLTEAADIARQTGAKDTEQWAKKILSQAHSDTGDFRKAYESLLRSYELQKEIYGEETAKKVAELQESFAAEKKSKEIEILNRETRIKELELSRQRMLRNALGLGLLLITGVGVVLYDRYRRRYRRRMQHLTSLEQWQESSRKLAHEIRTPLTALRLDLKRLVQAFGAEAPLAESEMKRCVESMSEELDRLADFAEQFAAFARIRKPEIVAGDVDTLVRDVCETFANAWGWVTIVRVEPAGNTHRAYFDRRMISQVLVNLCTNAANAMAGRPGTITLQAIGSGGHVQLSVRDTGPGLPEKVQERLFAPYNSGEGSREGLGLGLAISKKIMLDHGGDLTLVRTGTDGTEFRLVLPTRIG